MAQVGVAVEHDAVHLPALALVPVGARVHRHPRLDARVGLVDVGLEREAPVLRGRLHVREHLEPPGRAGGAERHLGGLHGRRRVAAVFVAFARRRLPVDAGDEREVVAREVLLGDLGDAAPLRVRDAHHEPAERVGVSMMTASSSPPLRRSASSSSCTGFGSGGASASGARRLRPRRLRRGRVVGRRVVGAGVSSANAGSGRLVVHGAHRRAATDCFTVGLAAPALRELVVADALVLDALLQHHDALQQRFGPRRAPGMYTSTGMIWSTPLVTEYESQYGPPQFAHEPIEITYFGSGICS